MSLSQAKRVKKAVGCKQVPVTPIQDLGQTSDDQASSQDIVSQKLDMMNMLIDLSSRVQAIEDQEREQAASPAARPSTSHPGRRWATTYQPSPAQELALSEEVRLRVARG